MIVPSTPSPPAAGIRPGARRIRPPRRCRFACAFAAAVLAALGAAQGCRSPAAPPPEPPAVRLAAPPLAPELRRELGVGVQASEWSWTLREDGRVRPEQGRAELILDGVAPAWRLAPAPPIPPDGAADSLELILTPAAPGRWHSQRVAWPPADPLQLLPLPRLPVDSPVHADLLALLQELTDPLFGQRVFHWPALPVPVRAGSAPSGTLDLAECLREAMDIWNEGEPEPVFAWDPAAAWGVRLVHLPDTRRSPPLAAALVRVDEQGRPLRIHILAGNNYDEPIDRRYAVRGLVHELGHARLLWGHSRERSHLLWRWGPIVSEPSRDERRAARLLALLPLGLELWRYGRPEPPDSAAGPLSGSAPAPAAGRPGGRP